MTVLRCLCGERIEGAGASLLEAVEAHLEESRRSQPWATGGEIHVRPQPTTANNGTHPVPAATPESGAKACLGIHATVRKESS